ncbi:LysM domain protein [Ancylostoma caninum]|uniref:LysM domain protein n=1 Tax=Ancylostoma caninum TaxID=29170 RepID=A0A368H285_ANCCA|nr:LysM domain protein [Ancylostoma caninum]
MSSESRPTEIAMRSRVARTSSDLDRRKDQNSYKDTVIIERKVKAGDTLNKIAIQYSVNVSDIKRVNNLVSDQDFVALTVVKIPISRMRHALGIGSSSSDDDEHIIDFDDRARLIDPEKHSRDPSVEEIFHKTDSAIAQVREALPEDGIPGSFHFVDARPPDSVCSVWLIVAAVVIIFMVVPLVLTFYEESEKEEQRTHTNV